MSNFETVHFFQLLQFHQGRVQFLRQSLYLLKISRPTIK